MAYMSQVVYITCCYKIVPPSKLSFVVTDADNERKMHNTMRINCSCYSVHVNSFEGNKVEQTGPFNLDMSTANRWPHWRNAEALPLCRGTVSVFYNHSVVSCVFYGISTLVGY